MIFLSYYSNHSSLYKNVGILNYRVFTVFPVQLFKALFFNVFIRNATKFNTNLYIFFIILITIISNTPNMYNETFHQNFMKNHKTTDFMY